MLEHVVLERKDVQEKDFNLEGLLIRLKAKGGITFAQDMSAEVPHIPLNAQASGFVDFVMPPEEISAKLKKLVAALKA